MDAQQAGPSSSSNSRANQRGRNIFEALRNNESDKDDDFDIDHEWDRSSDFSADEDEQNDFDEDWHDNWHDRSMIIFFILKYKKNYVKFLSHPNPMKLYITWKKTFSSTFSSLLFSTFFDFEGSYKLLFIYFKTLFLVILTKVMTLICFSFSFCKQKSHIQKAYPITL